VVTRDGVTLDEAIWGTTLPVDPGDHLVRAEAPGYEPWSTSVSITRRGDTVTVKVPKLSATAVVEKPQPERLPVEPDKPAPHASGGGHGLALGMLIGGAVVGLAGGGLMLYERQVTQDPKISAPDYNNAQTPWKLGLIAAIAGGAAGAAGIVLLLVGSGNGESHDGSTTTAWIAPGPGGVQIGGTF
jgi:hypothetical protein